VLTQETTRALPCAKPTGVLRPGRDVIRRWRGCVAGRAGESVGCSLRREMSSDAAMMSASTARSPSPRRSRACRRSLREWVNACGSGALQISLVLFEEVGLEGCSHFVDCLERVVDGQLPNVVVNHVACIPRSWLRLPAPRVSVRKSNSLRTRAGDLVGYRLGRHDHLDARVPCDQPFGGRLRIQGRQRQWQVAQPGPSASAATRAAGGRVTLRNGGPRDDATAAGRTGDLAPAGTGPRRVFPTEGMIEWRSEHRRR
jgi:hypothetical protein